MAYGIPLKLEYSLPDTVDDDVPKIFPSSISTRMLLQSTMVRTTKQKYMLRICLILNYWFILKLLHNSDVYLFSIIKENKYITSRVGSTKNKGHRLSTVVKSSLIWDAVVSFYPWVGLKF